MQDTPQPLHWERDAANTGTLMVQHNQTLSPHPPPQPPALREDLTGVVEWAPSSIGVSVN